jgi:hypothetical protein
VRRPEERAVLPGRRRDCKPVIGTSSARNAAPLTVLDDFSWRHVDERLYTDAAIHMLEHDDLATPRLADGDGIPIPWIS